MEAKMLKLKEVVQGPKDKQNSQLFGGMTDIARHYSYAKAMDIIEPDTMHLINPFSAVSKDIRRKDADDKMKRDFNFFDA
jgi:hypothetical protein